MPFRGDFHAYICPTVGSSTKQNDIRWENIPPLGVTADVTEYCGLPKIKMLPLRNLWISVLLYRESKLTFPLCRTCADTDERTLCQNDDEELALVEVWSSPEVKKALERSYRILRCYEVWHYTESRKSLFAEYIDHFLALKTQASGWPAGVKTEAEKETFLRDVLQTEGVQLDRQKMKSNSGMRALAKLCSNR